jgi:hypothetical protein
MNDDTEVTPDTIRIEAMHQAGRAIDRAANQALVDKRNAPPTEKQVRAEKERERERYAQELVLTTTPQALAAKATLEAGRARAHSATPAGASEEHDRARAAVRSAEDAVRAADAALIVGNAVREKAVVDASTRLTEAKTIERAAKRRLDTITKGN